MRPEAVDAMLPFLTERFGNPSGAHRWLVTLGAPSTRRVTCWPRRSAREPGEIVFTSGGTEADNLAVLGVPTAGRHGRLLGHRAPCGARSGRVPRRTARAVDAARRRRSRRACCRARHRHDARVGDAGQQRGRHDPAPRRGRRASCASTRPNAVLHTDAVQGFAGSMSRRPRRRRTSCRSAPTSSGARRARACSWCGRASSSHRASSAAARSEHAQRHAERRRHRRDGARAAELDRRSAATAGGQRLRPTRPAESTVWSAAVPRCDGRPRPTPSRIAGNCHVCIDGIESEALLFLLEKRGVFASAASSCASGAMEPSHVLAAMGVPPELARVAAAVARLREHRRRRRSRARGRPAAVERLRAFASSAGARP